LTPLTALCLGGAALSLSFDVVSGITLGFGAVLMGISVDYGLHVFFALHRGDKDRGKRLVEVARPIVFAALTTIGVFLIMLFSDIPAQRQLSVLSMTGLAGALLFSLLVLPLLMGRNNGGSAAVYRPSRPGRRKWSLILWLAVLGAGIWQIPHLSFNGNPREMALIPEELIRVEERISERWGNLRSMAMIFARGEDMGTALENNSRLFAVLQERLPEVQVLSLAPLLPSASAQGVSRELWKEFWTKNGERIRRDITVQGKELGFAETAFAPFADAFQRLPEPMEPEGLEGAGMGEILNKMIVRSDQTQGEILVMTLVPDLPRVHTLFTPELERELGVRFVSQNRFSKEISSSLKEHFVWFFSMACALVVLLLFVLYRSLSKTLLALVPVVTGILFLFAVMGAIGTAFNLYNMVAAILIMGLGVDYGIFMVSKVGEGLDYETEKAVLVSGFSTIAGFGALVLAEHPALHAMGLTVLVGIAATIPAAIVIIPLLAGRLGLSEQ
jgi:uncharacterized protein